MLTMCHSIIVLEKGRLIGNAPTTKTAAHLPDLRDLWHKQNRHLLGLLQNQAAS